MSSEHALREIKLDLRKYVMKPAKRSKVVKLSDMKEFFTDVEAAENTLTQVEIGFFLVVDIDRGRVVKLTPQQMEILLTTVDSFLA